MTCGCWMLGHLTGRPCAGGEVMTVLMGCIIGMMSLGRGAAPALTCSPDRLPLLTSFMTTESRAELHPLVPVVSLSPVE